MKIQCTDRKTFVLSNESGELGQIIYDGVFTFKAKAMISDDHYKFTPIGIFSTTIDVTQRGREIATMAMSWQGHIIISFRNGQEYRVKATGPFLNKYVLEDKNNRKLMLLDPDIQWVNLSYNFSVSYEEKPEDILMVLLAIYAAIFFMTASTGEG